MKLSLAVVLGLVAILAHGVEEVKADGLKDFHMAGYPTMILFAGLAFICAAIWYGMKKSGDDWKGSCSSLSAPFIIINCINVFLGIFLIFGPGSAAKVNVIGFQLLMSSAIGFYTYYSSLKAAGWALFVFILTNIFSIVGCFPLLGHVVAIYDTDHGSCLAYFGELDNDGFNRCGDTGYLQLIRTFSLFALFTLIIQGSELLVTVTGGTTMHAKEGAQAPLNTGYPEQAYIPPTHYEQPAAQQQQAAAVVPPVTGATGYQQL